MLSGTKSSTEAESPELGQHSRSRLHPKVIRPGRKAGHQAGRSSRGWVCLPPMSEGGRASRPAEQTRLDPGSHGGSPPTTGALRPRAPFSFEGHPGYLTMTSRFQVLFSGLCHCSHSTPRSPCRCPHEGRGLRKTRMSIYQRTDFPLTLTHLRMTLKVV